MKSAAAERKTKAAQKAALKQQAALQKAAKVTKQEGEAKVLEELTSWLRSHPQAASSILGSIQGGAWDEGSESDGSDRLPSYMNKVKSLSKAKICEFLVFLVPQMADWVSSLPRRVQKESLAEILGYMVHMAPNSAATTKVESKLKKDLKERFNKYGKRGASFDGLDSSSTEAGREKLHKSHFA